ncbi:MAG TPA: DNA-3-methyladenine glycosylase [Solirubrobacteraceae bacterium]|jgi:DNA-3-methyladenine glycosylase|nr:DNA-3-methyladenine glycosylase [Solirubrobacteraceae bacterium]
MTARSERREGAAAPPGKALAHDFYARPVVEVARALVGCTLHHGPTSGVIVETEAYHQSEPACHAYVGLTARTRPLFGPPGRAYVYRSYGIHALFNAVCEPEGVGAAVLIRALEPLAGIETMRERRAGTRSAAPGGRPATDRDLCSGPGKLTQALDIELDLNDTDLQTGPVRICEAPPGWQQPELLEDVRVGISRATELRWRFCAVASEHVSRPRPHVDPPRRRR